MASHEVEPLPLLGCDTARGGLDLERDEAPVEAADEVGASDREPVAHARAAVLGDAGVVAPQHEPLLVGERESNRILNLPLAHADLRERGQKPKRSLNRTSAHPGL